MFNPVSYQESQLSLASASEPEPRSPLPLPSFPAILFPDFDSEAIPISPITALSEDSANDGPTPAFTIDNLNKASWAVAKILESEARTAQRAQLAKDFKSRIDAWLESANKQDTDSISYLSFLLEPYVKNEISKLHNSKTLSLPTGLASLRKLPDRLDIIDSESAIAYCEAAHPDAIIIKKELDKSYLKDLILNHAEPIPGIAAELGADKLYIKPQKLASSPNKEKAA